MSTRGAPNNETRPSTAQELWWRPEEARRGAMLCRQRRVGRTGVLVWLAWALVTCATMTALLAATTNGSPSTGNDNNHNHNHNTSLQQPPANAKQIEQIIIREYRQRFQVNKAISDRAYYSLLAVYSIFIIAGTLSNLLICLTVLLNPRILSPRNIFIVNLASSDLLLCVFTMPFSFIEITMKAWNMGLLSCKLVAGLQSTSILVSTFSITAIALDRYRVIVYHSHQEGQYSMRRAGLMLASVWLGALLISLPLFLVRTLYHRDLLLESKQMVNASSSGFVGGAPLEAGPSLLAAAAAHTSSGSDPAGPVSIDYCIEAWPFSHGRGLYSIVLMILQYVLPITVVSIVYAMISDKLRKRLLKRQKSSQLQCQNKRRLNLIKRTHVMLFSVSLIFGLSWLPLHLINVISDFSDLSMTFEDQMYRLVFAVCTLVGCSSACTNPILYGYLNENFRKEMHQVYRHHTRHLFSFAHWLLPGAASGFGLGGCGSGSGRDGALGASSVHGAGQYAGSTLGSSTSFQDSCSSMGSSLREPHHQPEEDRSSWLAGPDSLSRLASPSGAHSPPAVDLNSLEQRISRSGQDFHWLAADAGTGKQQKPSVSTRLLQSPDLATPTEHSQDTHTGGTQIRANMSLHLLKPTTSNGAQLDPQHQRRSSYQTSHASSSRHKLGRTMRICLCISGASSNDTLNPAADEPLTTFCQSGAPWSGAGAGSLQRHFRRPGSLSPANSAPNGSITRPVMKGGGSGAACSSGRRPRQGQAPALVATSSGGPRAAAAAAEPAAGVAEAEAGARRRQRRRRLRRKRSCECSCHKAPLKGFGSTQAKRRTASLRIGDGGPTGHSSTPASASLRQRADSAGARPQASSPASQKPARGAPATERPLNQLTQSAQTSRAAAREQTSGPRNQQQQQGRRVWLHYLLAPAAHKHKPALGQEQASLPSSATGKLSASISPSCCKQCACSPQQQQQQPSSTSAARRTPIQRCQPQSYAEPGPKVHGSPSGHRKEKQQTEPVGQRQQWGPKLFQLKSVNDPSAYYLTVDDTGCHDTSLSKGCSTSVLALEPASDLEEEQPAPIVRPRRASTCTDSQRLNNGALVNNNDIISDSKRASSGHLVQHEARFDEKSKDGSGWRPVSKNQHVIEACDDDDEEEDVDVEPELTLAAEDRRASQQSRARHSSSQPSSFYACIHSSGSVSTCTCSSEFSLSCYRQTPATCDDSLIRITHPPTTTTTNNNNNSTNCPSLATFAGSLSRLHRKPAGVATTRSCSVSGATPTSLSGDLGCSWASFQSSASLEVARLTGGGATLEEAGSADKLEVEPANTEEPRPHHLDLKRRQMEADGGPR